MNNEFLHLFWLDGPARLDGGHLVFPNRSVPVENGIPRFTPAMSYSSENFGRLRERHATLQLDSRNGTTDRRNTILNRTSWPPSFFENKLVLECGCGAGPDTEILLSLGARVVSVDIAGVDVARANLNADPNVQFVQADIADLPLRRRSFDIVFCHRVLQHTPNPEATLRHILEFVRPGGSAFVHSYARSLTQMMRWKYALRPLTRRMDPERLYQMLERNAPWLQRLTTTLNKTRPGRMINHVFVPYLNYRHLPKLAALSDAEILEYGIHDTFDALSPRYDRPISPRVMEQIAREAIDTEFEVVRDKAVTLLRIAPRVGA